MSSTGEGVWLGVVGLGWWWEHVLCEVAVGWATGQVCQSCSLCPSWHMIHSCWLACNMRPSFLPSHSCVRYVCFCCFTYPFPLCQ